MKKRISLMLGVLMTAPFAASADQHTVAQKDKEFMINGQIVESLSINAGDSIRFVNEDPFFHNIFSLSELSTFDLGSFPQGDHRDITFDKAGTVEVECAIHPDMYMEVEVK